MGCNVSTAQGQVQQHAQLDSSGSKCRAAPLRSDLRSKETVSSVDSAFEVGVGGRAAPAQSIAVPRSVSVRGAWLSVSPALLTMDDFLTSAECDALIALGTPDLRRSRVTDGHVSSGRTSFSTFLTGEKASHSLVVTIEKRILDFVNSAQASLDEIEGITGSEAPQLVSAEPLQIVRYTQGQGYTSHYDNRAGSQARKATFMLYLATCESGGHTFFPRARVWNPDSGEEQLCSGIKIAPVKGRCVFFYNIRNGKEDECSLHEAMPVVSGDKWIATLWLGHAASSVAQVC